MSLITLVMNVWKWLNSNTHLFEKLNYRRYKNMKEEKTKKKFNKKLLTFGVLGMFAIALVAAGVYLYVGSASVTGTVDEPLIVSGDTFSFTGYPGTITDDIKIDNLANVPLNVELSWVELSNEADPFSLDNTAGTCDNYPNAGWRDECEKRIVLDGMPLADFNTMSWDVDVDAGYIAHVDVIIDIDGNLETTGDVDALVFEYAKVDPFIGCDEGIGNYPTGDDINTFGDKGIVDSEAKAWLGSGVSGGCTTQAFIDNWRTLAEWQTEYPSATILRFEIEVDNWIETSSSEVSYIVINGNEINVDYELTTTTAVVPIGLDNLISVTFTVADDSPVGDFTGVINVRRVA